MLQKKQKWEVSGTLFEHQELGDFFLQWWWFWSSIGVPKQEKQYTRYDFTSATDIPHITEHKSTFADNDISKFGGTHNSLKSTMGNVWGHQNTLEDFKWHIMLLGEHIVHPIKILSFPGQNFQKSLFAKRKKKLLRN